MLQSGPIPVRPADRQPSFTLADMEAASAAVRARRDGRHWCDNCLGIAPETCMLNDAQPVVPPVDAALDPVEDLRWWRRMFGGGR
jgi:hypothetical protein